MTMAAQRLQRIVGTGYLDSTTIARVLDKSPRTVVRWLRNGVAPRWESEQRLRELEAVLDRLNGVVEPSAAREWLFTPVPMLDYRLPADLVRDGEYRRVIAAIDAIGEGAFV
ncbi:MAG TPA: antitoxin Xre/MbcA/ParS toxin-binding domain-containing protein [Candidatus Limnocylindria bacterium]|jgi:uncharacterized protein (DUF2384 family)